VNDDEFADLAIVTDIRFASDGTTLTVLYGRPDRGLAYPTAGERITPDLGYRIVSRRFGTDVPARGGIQAAGDVNGDGADDILVAGFGLILGSAEPLPPNVVTLDDLREPRARRIDGVGVRVRPVGDVNDDGRADLLIAPPSGPDDFPTGRDAYVLLDAFATADSLAGGNLTEQPGFPLPLQTFSTPGINALGDVDGDGVDDLAAPNVRLDTGSRGVIVYGSREFQ